MRTAVDSNVFSAIWSNEPSGQQLTQSLAAARSAGAVIMSAPVFAELHAYPRLTEAFIEDFLGNTGVSVEFSLPENVWRLAGQRHAQYAARRRQSGGSEPRGLLADFIIGAHALLKADCLLTLDSKVYRLSFPDLLLI